MYLSMSSALFFFRFNKGSENKVKQTDWMWLLLLKLFFYDDHLQTFETFKIECTEFEKTKKKQRRKIHMELAL